MLPYGWLDNKKKGGANSPPLPFLAHTFKKLFPCDDKEHVQYWQEIYTALYYYYY